MKQLKITKFPALDYAGNEAFNTLSTNLSFAGASVKKIMITSCHAAEGKSYLSINLMRTLAQRGIKVALVNSLSIAVMGVLIGSGGLGYIIYRGIQQRNMARILIGAIPVVVIALFFDWAMTKIEQRLSTHTK